MKNYLNTPFLAFLCLSSLSLFGQETVQTENYKIQPEKYRIETVFNGSNQSVRGYGALTHKFTTLRGELVNISGVYGGVYLNHKFFLGLGASAMTSKLAVPLEFSTDVSRNLNYEYAQVGLVTEYVINSSKAYHLGINLFTGAGATVQNDRNDWNYNDGFDYESDASDKNWFYVVEPGVQFEINVFKWMRFSPGISYRMAFNSNGLGMKNADISNLSYNLTLKFGRF